MNNSNESTPSGQASQKTEQTQDFATLSGVDLIRRSNLVNEFVLVDGLGRSGKGMIGHILASMDRVEKVRLDLGYDTCHRLHRLGKITHDAAVCMLKIEADLGLYNNYIGREVNFRFKDMSGIWANTRPITYIRRLFSEEGAPAVQRIRQERPIFQSLSHDALQSAILFFDAFGDRYVSSISCAIRWTSSTNGFAGDSASGSEPTVKRYNSPVHGAERLCRFTLSGGKTNICPSLPPSVSSRW